MSELVTAIGLVLVIEGLVYAVSPGLWRRLAEQMKDIPDETLRTTGLIAIGVGVLVVWLAKNILA
ncbi:MAG: DUF2065 domain-containing protein [Anderseniella sp.]